MTTSRTTSGRCLTCTDVHFVEIELPRPVIEVSHGLSLLLAVSFVATFRKPLAKDRHDGDGAINIVLKLRNLDEESDTVIARMQPLAERWKEKELGINCTASAKWHFREMAFPRGGTLRSRPRRIVGRTGGQPACPRPARHRRRHGHSERQSRCGACDLIRCTAVPIPARTPISAPSARPPFTSENSNTNNPLQATGGNHDKNMNDNERTKAIILQIRDLAGQIGILRNELPGSPDAEEYEFQVRIGLAEAAMEILDTDVRGIIHWFGNCHFDFGCDPTNARIATLTDVLAQEIEAQIDDPEDDAGN